jgi:hypothetical protein
MKKLITLLVLAFTLSLPAFAADPVQAEAGPRGGRLLTLEGLKAEFFVEPDRTVTVSFYDDALAKVAPANQVVIATAETPSGKTKLEFQPKDGLLASTVPLPEGTGYTIVLQIRQTPDAKPKNFRISYETHVCGGCKRPEYACNCNH